MNLFESWAIAAGLVLVRSTALAQSAQPTEEPTKTPAITVSGSAAIVSDYRFRGISQTDKQMAV